jgi:hypothetical protein
VRVVQLTSRVFGFHFGKGLPRIMETAGSTSSGVRVFRKSAVKLMISSRFRVFSIFSRSSARDLKSVGMVCAVRSFYARIASSVY